MRLAAPSYSKRTKCTQNTLHTRGATTQRNAGFCATGALKAAAADSLNALIHFPRVEIPRQDTQRDFHTGDIQAACCALETLPVASLHAFLSMIARLTLSFAHRMAEAVTVNALLVKLKQPQPHRIEQINIALQPFACNTDAGGRRTTLS